MVVLERFQTLSRSALGLRVILTRRRYERKVAHMKRLDRFNQLWHAENMRGTFSRFSCESRSKHSDLVGAMWPDRFALSDEIYRAERDFTREKYAR